MISIIIPVYNVEKYLGECLDSVLAQSYKDIEVVLVDDGSTDSSGSICDKYAALDTRVRVIHQANAGRSAARNIALEVARGEYVGFVDSDDWIEPDMYRDMLAALTDSGADVAICGYWFEYTYGNRVKQPMPSEGLHDGREAMRMLVEDRYIQSLSCDKLFRRDVLDAPYPEGRDFYEDSAVMLRWFSRVKSVVIVPKPYYHYRMRRSGVVNSLNPSTYFDKFTADIERAEYLKSNIPGLYSDAELAASVVESGVMAAKKIARYCRRSDVTDRMMREIPEKAADSYRIVGKALRAKTARRFRRLKMNAGLFRFSVRLAFLFEFANRRKSAGCFD